MGDEGTPADAFEQLGHPSRIAILRALQDVRRSSADPHVGFSDLHDRSGIDDRGRFNYHLDQLRDTFVVEADDGYRLSAFGHRVLAPMAAGLYDHDRAPDPIDAPGECRECGSALRIVPRRNVLQVVCTGGHTVNHGLIGYPGVVADRPSEEAVSALGLLNAQAIELGVNGICPTCHGAVDGAIEASDEFDAYLYRAPCDTCGNQFAASVHDCVAAHPAVVSFLADRGVPRGRIPWELGFGNPDRPAVVSEEPLRLRVEIDRDDGSLSAVVDREGTVVSIERSTPEA